MQKPTDDNNFAEHSYLDYCLYELLKKLEWQGSAVALFESMPHMMTIDNEKKFSWVMKNVGYSSKKVTMKMSQLDENSLPCLFIPADGAPPIVILAKKGEQFLIYNSNDQSEALVSPFPSSGVILLFKKESHEILKNNHQHWFKEVMYDSKGMFLFLGVISLFQAFLFIAPSAYIMFLYDKVIYSHAYDMLASFFIGMVFVLVSLVVLMNIRTRILGHLSARLQHRIGNLIFIRLLRLKPAYLEAAQFSSQIIRINDFNQLRDFFGSQLFSAVLEVPFVLVFLIFIWIIAGAMVLVPIVAIVVYFIVAKTLWFFTRRKIDMNSAVRGKYQNYLLETVGGMRSLQCGGFQHKWFSNFKELSALSSHYGKNVLFLNSCSEAIYNALTILTGVATLIVGAVLIINEHLGVGAMIAVLFVIWRLLAPIKALASMYPRLVFVAKSAKQVNELMHYPSEMPAEHQWESMPTQIKGNIRFEQVSFRYPNADVLALKQITFSIKQGETLLVIGPSGAGKSTLANLLLCMYPILGGHIFIDDINVKQYDPNLLRKNISYVPQKTELFYGTIEQNLRLVKPLATDEELINAAKAANLLDVVNKLPDGFNTRVRFYGDDRIGVSFNQKLSLARAYLRSAPILIFDEPTNSLDNSNGAFFKETISRFKGEKTSIILSHGAKFADLADQVIVLYDGFIVSAGKPEEVLKSAPKGTV